MEKDCLEAVNVCYQTFKIACKKSTVVRTREEWASLEKSFDKMDDAVFELMSKVGAGIFDDGDEGSDEETGFSPPHSRN